ncbi:MAG: ribosome small subunit-dependent GTPase A [Candidatus Eremiobacteraeota bacterium]|nr:ribosome small subunit-dependent GTPase A [Candidatus Eremiobacteraeota bacterium]MCW5869278.1 ribosome small subunit-dependent GTPase A [Candidatus Eremiobacteraeota bacterium]
MGRPIRRRRGRADRRPPVIQLLTRNLNRLVIVASLTLPDLRVGMINRLLVLAEQERLQVIIVLTKLDLLEDAAQAEATARLYRALGYGCILTSIHTGQGVDELRRELGQGRSALCGHSGVGKSSLLGLLQPNSSPLTGEVSLATGKGRHTTTTYRLVELDGGGEIYDLPGFKLVPISLERAELKDCFPEFATCDCRYRNCMHLEEPACGVLEAVASGRIATHRYESYRFILDTLEEKLATP